MRELLRPIIAKNEEATFAWKAEGVCLSASEVAYSWIAFVS